LAKLAVRGDALAAQGSASTTESAAGKPPSQAYPLLTQ
jgi:hypothetical protein